uniref:Uncharacterized protein n=1 Tax=Anguilla anguilla TaxID=7936 RepID=A0A0E9S5T8_ANGAN
MKISDNSLFIFKLVIGSGLLGW